VALGAWIGAAVGLLEPLLILLKRGVLDLPAYTSPQLVWQAPLAYGVMFAALAAVLHLLGSRLRWFASPRLVAMVSTYLGVYSALQVLHVQLHPWAVIILAVGLAVQAGSLAARRVDSAWALVRRTGIWLAVLIVALGMGVNVIRGVRERQALAALDAPRAGLPNVLVIILDTVRAASLSLYGHERPTTPELERLARTGVVFDRAVSPSSWSNPSHAALLTGQFAYNVSSDWGSNLDATHPTMAEVFAHAGYATGIFSANTRYITRESGMGRGFAVFDDHPVLSAGAVVGATWLGRWFADPRNLRGQALGFEDLPGRKQAPDVLEPMLGWIDEVRADRPFLAVANLMDGHEPYVPPEPFMTRFGGLPRRSVLARGWGRVRRALGRGAAHEPASLSIPWEERSLRRYEESIAYLDHEMGRLFAELERRGILNHTIVVITSDHGEEFAEHGIMGHGKSLYWPVVHVPLALWYGDQVPHGLRVTEPVTLRAIPVTVATLAGIEGTALPGRSLVRAWTGDSVVGDTALTELTSAQDAPQNAPIAKGDMKAVVADSLHYIRNGDGSEEVFDVVRDPKERDNLLERLDPVTLGRLRALIDAIPRQARRVRQTF
jgi:arylsulfatase A-like enzyme